MMLQKLLTILKGNSAKLLVKYDGERNAKKYTVRLLYSDIRRKSLGCDTDFPCVTLKEIFVGYNSFEVEELLSFFANSINNGIDVLISKYGDQSVISVMITEKDNEIMYTIHIQTTKGSKYRSDTNYKQLYENLML